MTGVLGVGTTASLRGANGFSAFAGAKFALRALAQSMARELGPQGIHVAHSIIDGAIDTDFIRENPFESYRDELEQHRTDSHFLGHTMFWKHSDQIPVKHIYHTDNIESLV